MPNASHINRWRILETLDMKINLEHLKLMAWDAFEKPDTGKVKVATIKHSELMAVDHAGYCPWLDEPEKCVALINAVFTNAVIH